MVSWQGQKTAHPSKKMIIFATQFAFLHETNTASYNEYKEYIIPRQLLFIKIHCCEPYHFLTSAKTIAKLRTHDTNVKYGVIKSPLNKKLIFYPKYCTTAVL